MSRNGNVNRLRNSLQASGTVRKSSGIRRFGPPSMENNVKKTRQDAGRETVPHELAMGDFVMERELSAQDRKRLQARQAQSIMRMTPWTLSLNVLISLLMWRVGLGELPELPLHLWTSANVLASLIMLTHWWLASRHCGSRTCAAGYVHVIRIQGMVFGLVWAALPFFFLPPATGDMRVLIAALTIAAFSLGTFRLAQVPTAAMYYIIFPTASLVWTAHDVMPGPVGHAFAFMSALYALALIFVVLMRYRDALRQTRYVAELNRRKNIISLLLHDFEQGASDWLWETDRQGRLVYTSKRLEELLGVRRQELHGRRLHEALQADVTAPEWEALLADLEGGRIIYGSTVPARVGGEERWFRMTARPLYDASGRLRGYRGVATDVTEQHRKEERLRREKEAAESESRAKSNFLALISHELRTPLNAMVGFSELLTREAAGPLNDEYREYSRHVLDGSRQLQRLINDILDYTRFERNKIRLQEQEVDLVELAEMALRQVAREERARGLRFELCYADDVVLRADLGRMKQILSNLLNNAVKFTPEGSVTVDIDRNAEGDVVIRVIDTGIGIPEDKLKTIFEPFTQVDAALSRRHDGIGLGLSIARSLVQLHGGRMWIENNPSGGVTAGFTIPADRVIEEAAGNDGQARREAVCAG